MFTVKNYVGSGVILKFDFKKCKQSDNKKLNAPIFHMCPIF
jgi:hypothetical protein